MIWTQIWLVSSGNSSGSGWNPFHSSSLLIFNKSITIQSKSFYQMCKKIWEEITGMPSWELQCLEHDKFFFHHTGHEYNQQHQIPHQQLVQIWFHLQLFHQQPLLYHFWSNVFHSCLASMLKSKTELSRSLAIKTTNINWNKQSQNKIIK